MTTKGCDSATEPTIAQAKGALLVGIRFWGFYVKGPSATHDWSKAGVDILREVGIRPLPIYVPEMGPGGFIASKTPEDDAAAFVAAYQDYDVNGAGALDTEASMRGFAWTAQYVSRFCTKMRELGQADIVYAGGFEADEPPACTYKWWIVGSAQVPNKQCYQVALNSVIDGVGVDINLAGTGFPFATFTGDPPEHPVTAEPSPATVTLNADGKGTVTFDLTGSPGVTHKVAASIEAG